MIKLFSKIKKKRSLPVDLSANEIVVASGTIASGNLKTDRDVFIDGSYHGSVQTKGYIKLGGNGQVSGELKCRAIRVSGKFKGELHASSEIVVEGGGELRGNADARSIEINKDSIVQAKITTRIEN
jgi:cytoskeletal protein CcmA (bactofilin family)